VSVSDFAQEVIGRTVRNSYLAAWHLGCLRFGISDDPPVPRGLVIGEAPGPNSDARVPLFPEPRNSAGRLMRYAGCPPADWIGKLVKMNLCDGAWSTRRAVNGRARALTYLLDPANFHDGAPLRVLLLGARVARAWSCHGAFGHETHAYDCGATADLRVAWIPHPSGKNLLYNDRKNQLRARRAVLWAIGERATP
jgi:hypothetical protein